jgi:cobalt-zinc-cadmium efflux system outer membrane protein
MKAPRSRGRQPRVCLAALTALGLGALPVSGCAGPGLAARHRVLEDAWRASEGAPAAARAAEDLPAPDLGGPVLSRPALVRAVLERNPSVRAARYAWKAALDRYPQETSLDDPILGYGVGPASFDSSKVHPAHKVDLSQRLPFPGKLGLRGEIALAEAEAAAGDFEAVRLRLATTASLLFDQLYLLQRSLEINAEHIALLDEFLHIATVRYEAGEASQQDPLQAEVERTHLVHRDVVLRSEQRVAEEQVNALLHRAPDAGLPPPPAALALPPDAGLDREALTSQALDARPELQAARARVAGRESGVALARREFFPDLNVVGTYNGLWQETELQPFVAVQVNVPLQLARRRAALDEAQARLIRAESERASLEDGVRLAVASAVSQLEEARHVVHLYANRLLPAASDQVEAARAGFESGRNSFLALIDAERNLRNVRLGYEEAQAEVGRRLAELDQARGHIPALDW